MRALAILVVIGLASAAHAQPGTDAPNDPAVALREANAAASAGDWQRVAAFVQPLLARQLDKTDLAEAHRLAGIAALYAQPPDQVAAEHHFVAYLRIDLDAHLDPTLYPPEVVNFFNDVRARHAVELKALRPKSKRYAVLAVLPPFAQFQNGEKVKGIVVGSLLGAFLATNLTTYFVLRSWCSHVSYGGNVSSTCDDNTNHAHAATTLRGLNIATGVGFIFTYAYGVYDGIRGYRRESRERALVPYVTTSNGYSVVGVGMSF
jgi:hypothetical protein